MIYVEIHLSLNIAQLTKDGKLRLQLALFMFEISVSLILKCEKLESEILQNL